MPHWCDDQDAHQVLPDFIKGLSDAGVKRFIIHARKAWLQGLSPKKIVNPTTGLRFGTSD